jgi:hypothetical protein
VERNGDGIIGFGFVGVVWMILNLLGDRSRNREGELCQEQRGWIVPGTERVNCARNREGGLCQEQRGWIVPGTERVDCARNREGELCQEQRG